MDIYLCITMVKGCRKSHINVWGKTAKMRYIRNFPTKKCGKTTSIILESGGEFVSDDYKGEKRELTGKEGMCVLVPWSIVFNQDIGKSRVLVYSYLSCKTTMDYSVYFSIGGILKWVGKKIDRHLGTNSSTDDVIKAIEYYRKIGLLKYEDQFKLSDTLVEGVFDKDLALDVIEQDRKKGYRFTKIYLDEIESIVNYRNLKSSRLSADVIILVFAYLRCLIPMSNNLAGASYEPDAYDTHYNAIAEEIGLSERIVSKAISILVELGLIYEKRRGTFSYYAKMANGTTLKKYRENTYIFCNTTKRVKGKNGKPYMVAEGSQYYLHEADEKEKKLNRMKR